MKPLQDSDPRSIGPYQSLGVLGAGGMGRVYLGVDADGHQAAVKVVYADLVRDEDFRKRFTREASATARVSGRFIAQVVASDLEATPPWLATEYIDGPSLHDAVAKQGGALSPSRAQEIAASLAEALDTIHAAGVVHRDVKPANVLLGPDGAYLIDFGIAREAAASTITRTGTVVGTPPFMAPEQIRGRRTLGPPADIFALGGVLAYATTGRHPFGEGDNTSLAYRIVHEEPDLDGVEDQIVKALILACLAKNPEDRPTAGQVQARLSALAGPEGNGGASEDTVVIDGAEPRTLAQTPTESLPPTGQRRRRWTMVALATAAVLVISAGILGAGLGGSKRPGDSGKAALGGGEYPGAAAGASSSSSSPAPGATSPDAQAATSGSPGSHSAAPPPTLGTTTVSGTTSIQGAGPGPGPDTSITTSQSAPNQTTPTSSTRKPPPSPPSTSKPVPPPPTSSQPRGSAPQPPTGATATVGTASGFSGFVVTIAWQPVSGATGYDIHYTNNGTSTGGTTTDTTYHTADTSYQVSGWQAYPTGYCYSVRAVNAYGVSAWDSGSPHCS
ncbi:protein kinase [Catenulispora sp. NL8]|uniref:Protein kinase n=1 Tax=Catenulispora pinistramenti TaxID=2705254 RepID=A0ABS5L0R1_9ACTN|nr:protein kinase [Catenulispora pinistramenti]MBS2551913.1 protein kinase [Catenulispora pinistramenti]